jgi:hypothetical protein
LKDAKTTKGMKAAAQNDFVVKDLQANGTFHVGIRWSILIAYHGSVQASIRKSE